MKPEEKSRAKLLAAFAAVLFCLHPPAALAGEEKGEAERAFKGVDESAVEHEGKTVKEIRLPELRWADEEFIRRVLATKEGQAFTKWSADKDFEHLDKLRIFSYIRVSPFDDDGEVVQNIEVKETWRWIPTVSAKVSDANGISLGLGFKAINMFGQAVKWTGDVRGGGTKQISTGFSTPWVLGVPWSFTTGLSYVERENKQFDYDEKTFQWSGIFGKTITENITVGLRFNIMYLDDDEQGNTLDPDGRDEIFQGGLVLVYDALDAWTNPREGVRLETWGVKTGGFLPGDGDWWTFILDGRSYFKISERNTLLLSGFLEYQSGEVGEDFPEYMQFDFGGANSIRGWDTGSRFGKSQLIGTAEWLTTVVEPKFFSLFGKFNGYMGLQTALFGDVGLLWNDKEGFRSDEVIGGVGISLRPLLPFISYLRFDFAYGEPGEGISFFLGAGNKLNKHKRRNR